MFQGMTPGNLGKRNFSLLEREKLSSYVYALKDPRDQKVFYIGQGNGNRLFEHFIEAENYLNNPSGIPSSKIMRILDVWVAEEDVEWLILSSGHSSDDKNLLDSIESAIIDTLSKSQNGPALNAVSGPHSTFLSEIDLVQIDAPHIDPEEEYGAVFIFPIHGALADGENLYNATRKAWRVPEKYRSLHNAIAVGIKEYISLSAYSIKEWIPHNETKYEFNGKEYLELEHMNWRRIISDAMGYWQRGNYLVVSFDGNGSFRFLRGNPDREWRSIKEFVLV